MTTASILTLLSTVASLLPTIENAGQVVLTFAYGAISAVEQTGKTGDEKLAAVLNGAETAFKGLGAEALAADFSAVAAPLEAAVNDVVAIYNAAGIFVKDAEATIKSL